MPASFTLLYEKWILWKVENPGRNPELETELTGEYRTAWEMGSEEDRRNVLSFILDQRDARGVDLVGQGIRSSEPRLARRAAVVAYVLITDGVDMGPTILQDLEELAVRFPEWDIRSSVSEFLSRGEG